MKISSIQSYNLFIGKNNKEKRKPLVFNGRFKPDAVSKTDVVTIFEDLAKIPSPPLKENIVAKRILSFCKDNNIPVLYDRYKNLKLKIPSSDTTKMPLLLSAHMDVVGDDSPVKIVKGDNFIRTDGKRTLGADDKSGVAVALLLAKEIVKSNIKHGGLEILFTRDEELGMTGIKNADFKDFESKYVLVLDEARLGKLDNSGAGYTTVIISVKTPYGGHSGLDISDKSRLNAAKVISQLLSKIPQGVWYKYKNSPVTSVNHGTIIAGDIQNAAAKIVQDNLVLNDYRDYFIKNSVTNVINTNALATLSIRSSVRKKEDELRQKILKLAESFNNKYKNLVSVNVSFDELIPIFEKSDDKTLENFYKESCKNTGLKPCIGTFQGGAESHIYANMKNKNGEKFSPVLLGVADIYDMHSPQERMNIQSLMKGYELVKDIFLRFNSAK